MQYYELQSWLDTPHNWTFVINGREVLRILRDYNVLAVLKAHSHVYARIELTGLPLITTGAVRLTGIEELLPELYRRARNMRA
jgi:hypothetical protein